MQVGPLGREDPSEEEMATRSRILAREIPWTGEPGGLQSMGLQRRTRLSVHACHLLQEAFPDLTSRSAVSSSPQGPAFHLLPQRHYWGPCLPQTCVLEARMGLAVAGKAQGERSWTEPCGGLCAPWNRSVRKAGTLILVSASSVRMK